MRLPHRRFNRNIGSFAGYHFDLDGNPISADEWRDRAGEWLPTEADRDYLLSVMQQVTEPGKIANWIAGPPKGINGLPFGHEYVKL